MTKRIESALVLGAGVMGSQIAAHLANAGIKVYLLDVVPGELTREEQARGLTLESPEVRNRLANNAGKRLQEMKPAALYTPDDLDLIIPGNFEDHLSLAGQVDWIIEAVVEDLRVKQDLWRRVEQHWKAGTIVSTNTSGIPIAQVAAANSPEFRKYFLGTHFFNPPRYMKLLELIPSPDTDPDVIRFFKVFAERVLGKGVVIARDTPNFIANRIGTYGLMVTVEAMEKFDLTPEEVDAITGPAMGRPRSATFRTLDMVGIDVLAHVASNIAGAVTVEPERSIFKLPGYIKKLLERGWLGDKTGQGFYKQVRAGAEKEIYVLDLSTMDYRPRKKASFPSLEAAKGLASLKERLRTLLYSQDKAGLFAWYVQKKVLLYAAAKLGEIAEDIVAIDQAMRWGYNWEMGPFEVWDAIGVRRSVERMKAEGEDIPLWVEEMLAAGHEHFYSLTEGVFCYFSPGRGLVEPEKDERVINLGRLKSSGKLVRSNPGASLIDIGDEVLCLEFHSPKEAIGADIINMIRIAADEVDKNWRGLVIGSEAPNFAVGANLMMILMEAQDENWDELDWMVRQFQQAALSLKYLPRPVVAAPFGLTLGGGVELSFGADYIQASAETYMGLVEVGVGLIPAGGGCKEMWRRAIAEVPGETPLSGPFDLQPYLNRVFETIATAKVSTSAAEARKIGYLRQQDRVSINKDHQLWEAKQMVLYLDRVGYRPPRPQMIPVLGDAGRAVIEAGLFNLHVGGTITDHDYLIGKKLARVLTGGDLLPGTRVPEQYLLDLEREAFLSLCGHPRTQARIQHMLTKGKTLRN